MKTLVGRVLLSREFQNSVWAGVIRRFIRATSSVYSYSPSFLTDIQAVERPHYAYCLLNAADLARRLGIARISALEFGVAGGNGLAFLSDFGRAVERLTGVAIDCYGFDTGEGMPDPAGAKDLPYWFRAQQYRMDEKKLRERLTEAKLVIGNVSKTVAGFLEKYDPAPIGVVINDTDYWSSTRDSLKLFDGAADRPEHFLPRLYLYFDDIIGSAIEMYGPYNGQLAAIEEFNASHPSIKVHRNQNLLADTHRAWRHQVYYAHLFDHPRYGDYIGGMQQDALESALRLR